MGKVPMNAVESISFNAGWKNGVATPRQNLHQTIRTPRPVPQACFFQEQLSFSTKKEKAATPRDAQPPRPPAKSTQPVSRIFPHSRVVNKAQPVTFKAPEKSASSSIVSPHYNACSRELYFDQCFEIEERLGAGSFGEVFKVRSKEDGKFYAIKRSRDRFRGEIDRKRKLEEVAEHEKLRRHPNCVRFYKAWEEKEHLYIQTELCKTTLNHLSDKYHNIPERLIKNYLVDLLMAVKHLHDSDLIHMDIKPENIFISDTNDCKLGDFGLVLDLSNGSDFSEAQEGDPRYLAPELLQGQFGKPADVFSVGITILELASDLDLPRGGELWHQLRQRNIPDNLCALSPDLRAVIISMLEPDPRIRPTVNLLLQNPVIKQIWKQRRREQLRRKIVSSVVSVFRALWLLLCTVWHSLIHPLHCMLPNQLRTPTKADGPAHPPDWDHSFSEDEVGHDDSINMNNSMCAPLDFSTSSEESLRESGFTLPSISARLGLSQAGRPHRVTPNSPRYQHSSPVSKSPSKGFRSRSTSFSSPRYNPHHSNISSTSSQDRARSASFSSPRPGARPPSASCQRSLLLHHTVPPILPEREPEPSRLSIEPKNLMGIFDGESTDEDI